MSLKDTFTSHSPVIGFSKHRYDQKYKPSPRQQPRMRNRGRRRFPKPKR